MARKATPPKTPQHPTESETRALVAAFEYVSAVWTRQGHQDWHVAVAGVFRRRIQGLASDADVSAAGAWAYRMGTPTSCPPGWTAAQEISAAVTGTSPDKKITADAWRPRELAAYEAMATWLCGHHHYAQLTATSALTLLRQKGAEAIVAVRPAGEALAASDAMERRMLGALVSAARRHKGLSVEAAAGGAKVTANIWTRVERGTGKPDPAVIGRIVGALGLTTAVMEARHTKAMALALHMAELLGLGEGADWPQHAEAMGFGDEVGAVLSNAACGVTVKA